MRKFYVPTVRQPAGKIFQCAMSKAQVTAPFEQLRSYYASAQKTE